MNTTAVKLAACLIAVPTYFVVVYLTSDHLPFGYREDVWTIEYLVPAVVALALSAAAFWTKVDTALGKAARRTAVGANLLFFAALAAATVTLWGDFL